MIDYYVTNGDPELLAGAVAVNDSVEVITGDSWGDPHQITFDGIHYDFQAAGEFVFLESALDNRQIQVRQEP